MLFQLVIVDPVTDEVYISAPHRMTELMEIYTAVKCADDHFEKLITIQEYFDGRLV